MVARRSLILVLAGVVASMGAGFRTNNFAVDAPTQEIAQRVGQYAEHYRKEKAVQWLGKEMPQWPERCPIKVSITSGGAGGATEFDYRGGEVYTQRMHIEGKLDRLLESVLPHEITHTVFAYRFRRPVPRWADEGGAVLSEDDQERNTHDQMVRGLLSGGRAMTLRRLFVLEQYPSDGEGVMSLYAQGYSVSSFLVESSSRPAFLAFVAEGMDYGWDRAVKSHYGFDSVNDLEKAWIKHLQETNKRPLLTRAARPSASTGMETSGRLVIRRDTAPPVQPLLSNLRPAPREESQGWEDSKWSDSKGRSSPSSEGNTSDPDPWRSSPARQSDGKGPRVRLLDPEFSPDPSTTLGPPVPTHVSPVGYPH